MKPNCIWLMNYDNGRMTKVDIHKFVSVGVSNEVVDGKVYDYTFIEMEDNTKIRVVESPKEIGRLMIDALMFGTMKGD